MNSVCIATYNGEKFLKEELDSILSQIAPDDEVIISDDGSTDATCQIVEGLNDKRIVLLHHNKHNYIKNFEHAMRHARGEIIFLADQDDVWLPHKYKTCVDALQNADCVCTNSMITDENLNVICDDFFQFQGRNSHEGVWYNIIRGSFFGSCMAFKKYLLHYALPLPLPYDYDWWIGNVSDIVGKSVFVQKPCLLYRRHQGTVSSVCIDAKKSFFNRSTRPTYIRVWTRIQRLWVTASFYIKYKTGYFDKI